MPASNSLVLDGQVALVSGAGRGIGRAIAIALAEAGAQVGVNDLASDRAGETTEAIVASGGRAMPLAADVADYDAVEGALAKLVERFGRLDIAVSNAAYSDREPYYTADLAGSNIGVRADLEAGIGQGGHAQGDRYIAIEALAGRAVLEGSTADTIVGVAARGGDQALWDALVAASERAKSPEEKYRYLYALSDFEDPALVQRGLEYALTPALRAQDAGRYLGRFLGNPAVHARAWTFVKEHWTELEPKMTVAFADVRIVQALGSFCDAAARDDVVSFFASHTLGNASRTVDQTIEQINSCIALREKQTDSVSDWLRAR